METKTIILSEKEGKRYELHLFEDHKEFWLKARVFWEKGDTIYSGETECFIDFADKEEIAEKVVEQDLVSTFEEVLYKHYSDENYAYPTAIRSLESAIGEYKYIIITEGEI